MGGLDTAAYHRMRACSGAVKPAVVALFAQHTIHTPLAELFCDAITEQDPVLEFLSEHVKPGQPIFVYPYAPVYYFLSAARNPTRYSLLLYGLNTEAQFREVVQSLESNEVRYVVWDRSSLDSMRLWFPAYRIPPPNDLIIEPYLLDHYRVIGGSEQGYRFLERKNASAAAVLEVRSGADRQ